MESGNKNVFLIRRKQAESGKLSAFNLGFFYHGPGVAALRANILLAKPESQVVPERLG
jgi:hypothetical protein